MNISEQTIKKLMIKELESHYSTACQTILHEVQLSFVHIGYRYLLEELKQCETYESLDKWLSLAEYRMSLQEWIDSL